MAQQKEDIIECSACNEKLQVKVKFCPFCSEEYVDLKLQAEQAEKAKQAAAEAKRQKELAAQVESERQKAAQERQRAEQAEKEQQEKDLDALKRF